MERLKLTEDQLTGINEIDCGYRKLFAMINNALLPENRTFPAENVISTLEFLYHYMNEQFPAEERVLHYYGYDCLGTLRKQHRELRLETERLYHRANKVGNDRPLALDLYNLLNDRIPAHIMKWSRSIASFVKKCTSLEFKTPVLADVDFVRVKSLDFADGKASPPTLNVI